MSDTNDRGWPTVEVVNLEIKSSTDTETRLSDSEVERIRDESKRFTWTGSANVTTICDELLRLRAEREQRGIRYPHFCCDGHENIGHANSDDDERCPLCRVIDDLGATRAERDRLRAGAMLALEWFAGFPHQGQASDFDRRTADDVYKRLTEILKGFE